MASTGADPGNGGFTRVCHCSLGADGTADARSYDDEGRLLAATDRGGRVTRYLYDAIGRLLQTTFVDGTSTSSVYDVAGRLQSSTDPTGNITTYGYDAAGRRTQVLDALGGQTDFVYDAAGNQVAVTDPNRHTTRFVYDDAGRLIETELPDGTTRTVGYDDLGRRIAETDQAGQTTRFGYDALGRLATVTDALAQVTRYAYDELGNRIAQTDANLHTTRFTYDALGRQIGRELPDGAAETMRYDVAGNLAERTDFRGRTITFAYDVANRLVAKTYPAEGGGGGAGTGEAGGAVSFTYTATGRRASMVDGRGTTVYRYDDRDRLVEMVYPDGRALGYAYDASGRRTRLEARLGGDGGGGGAGAGGVTLATTYAYDALGRLAQVTDPQGRSYEHGYDASGNRASLRHPNGVVTDYGYDALNRLRTLVSRTQVGTVVQSYAYTLGPAGNRTRIDESDGADGGGGGGAGSGTSRSYAYDALYRLVGESVAMAGSSVYSKTFGYDPVGNRLQQVHTDAVGTVTTTNYTYDDRDRLLTEGAQSWTWDVNGNLAEKVEEAAYAWDFDDRLEEVTLADGTVVTHTYDADGVRVRSETVPAGGGGGGGGAVVTEYLVDTSGGLSQVVLEGPTPEEVAAYYVRGDDLLAVLRPDGGGGGGGGGLMVARFYHADGLGSVRALTDETGVVTDRWDFTAFGELLAHVGQDVNAYLFAGEMLDPNVGWYYNRARWMDPAVGRFGSVDPLDSTPRDRQFSTYQYCNLDPVGRVDPLGLESLGNYVLAGSIVGVVGTIALNAFVLGTASTIEFDLDGVMVSTRASGTTSGLFGAGGMDLLLDESANVSVAAVVDVGLSPLSTFSTRRGLGYSITAGPVFDMDSPSQFEGWGHSAAFPLSLVRYLPRSLFGKSSPYYFLMEIARRTSKGAGFSGVVGFSKPGSLTGLGVGPGLLQIGLRSNDFSNSVSRTGQFRRMAELHPVVQALAERWVGTARGLQSELGPGGGRALENPSGFLDAVARANSQQAD